MKTNTIEKPELIGGKPVNENAWNYCVDLITKDKVWAEIVSKDEQWMKGACTISREWVTSLLSKSSLVLAMSHYSYCKMRHDIGISCSVPAAYRSDINDWQDMIAGTKKTA